MKKRRFYFMLPTLVSANVALASAASGQTAGATLPDPVVDAASGDATDQTADIIVTAQKREQTLSDVPMSITALTGSQLADRGITDVQSLTKVTPGLSFVESGSGVPVYSLRGVGFFDTTVGARPTVSVYLDEVALPFSIMSQGAALDLQRVEVLKGPQGTLFGQNSTGGAINYIAAKPTGAFHAGGSVNLGRFETVDATGYLDMPLGQDVALRVSARALHSGDWQRSYTRDDTLGAKRFLHGRAILELRPTERLTINLAASGFRDRSDTQAAQLIGRVYNFPAATPSIPAVVNYPVAPHDNRAADWGPVGGLRRDNRFVQFSARGDYEIAESLTLTSITAYSHMNVDQLVDQDGTDQLASLNHIVGRLSSFSQEVRLVGGFGPATVTVGGNYALDKSSEQNIFLFPYTTSANATVPGFIVDATTPDARQKFRTIAGFGNLDLTLTDSLTAHGGIRLTRVVLDSAACARVGDEQTSQGITFLINLLRSRSGLGAIPAVPVGACYSFDRSFTPGQFTDRLKESNISWRLGLDWKPTPQTLIYANVSRGYKSGSAPTLIATEQSQFAPVVQEAVTAYEVGAKVPIVRRMLEATGAIFYYDYTDKQVLGRRPTIIGLQPGLVNVPKSRLKGAEIQFNAFPARGLTLVAAGTYLDSKVTGDFNNFTILSTPANFRGDRYPYTPKWQFVGDAQYEFDVSEGLKAFTGVNATYRSGATSGFGNDDRLNIDAYTLVDVRAGVRSRPAKWEASIFIRNLTNQYYWTNVARLSDVIRRYAGEPRVYGLRLAVNM